MMNDFEMDQMETKFRASINKKTARRRRMAEIDARRKAAIEYIYAREKEMCREKGWDRMYMCAALAMLSYAFYCANAISILSLSLTVPAMAICASVAFGCLVDAIRLFVEYHKGGKRK